MSNPLPTKRQRATIDTENVPRGIENPDNNMSWAIAATQLLIACDLVTDEVSRADVPFEQADRDVVRNVATALSQLPIGHTLSNEMLAQWVEQKWGHSDGTWDAADALAPMAMACFPPSEYIEQCVCVHCHEATEGRCTRVNLVTIPAFSQMHGVITRDHILASMGRDRVEEGPYMCDHCNVQDERYIIHTKWNIKGPLLLQLPRFTHRDSGQATRSKWTWEDWNQHVRGGIIHSNGSNPTSGQYRVACPRASRGQTGVTIIHDAKIYGGRGRVPEYVGKELYIVAVGAGFFPMAWLGPDIEPMAQSMMTTHDDPTPEFVQGEPEVASMDTNGDAEDSLDSYIDPADDDSPIGAPMVEDVGADVLVQDLPGTNAPQRHTQNGAHQYKGIMNQGRTCWMAAAIQLLHHNDFIVPIPGEDVNSHEDIESRKVVLHFSYALDAPPAREPLCGKPLFFWGAGSGFDPGCQWDTCEALLKLAHAAGGVEPVAEVRVSCCLTCGAYVDIEKEDTHYILHVPRFEHNDDEYSDYEYELRGGPSRKDVVHELERKHQVENVQNPFWCCVCKAECTVAEQSKELSINGRTILQLPRFHPTRGSRLRWLWSDFGDDVRGCILHVGANNRSGHFRYVHLTGTLPNRGMIVLDDHKVVRHLRICKYVPREVCCLVVEPSFFPQRWRDRCFKDELPMNMRDTIRCDPHASLDDAVLHTSIDDDAPPLQPTTSVERPTHPSPTATHISTTNTRQKQHTQPTADERAVEPLTDLEMERSRIIEGNKRTMETLGLRGRTFARRQKKRQTHVDTLDIDETFVPMRSTRSTARPDHDGPKLTNNKVCILTDQCLYFDVLDACMHANI